MKTDEDGFTRFYPRLQSLFCFAWLRHLKEHRYLGDYQVCTSKLCRICWQLENWLWYAGEIR